MIEPTPTTIVIPTIGRPMLYELLASIEESSGPRPAELIVVDDRADGEPLELAPTRIRIRVLRSYGVGPAAARNRGWRAARTVWVSFLDDDVRVSRTWARDLADDIAACRTDDAGTQGRVEVPLPADRRPTDWERNVAGLARARYITADMTYRRASLLAVDGFDERFRRAYREDADLALRIKESGEHLRRGDRRVAHPVRDSDGWISVRLQRGNADDALMRALHGSTWRRRADAPAGRFARHLVTVAMAAVAGVGALTRRRSMLAFGLAGWMAETAIFAWRRIEPGPRDGDEMRRMVVTSVVIPFAAVGWRLAGLLEHRNAPAWSTKPRLVLFDRDGTLVHDVPYNGDPDLVAMVDGASRALDSLRRAGIATGVVTNQSGVARGAISVEQMRHVNERVEELLGPFDTWHWCVHGPDSTCACRKPEPGMVLDACLDCGVNPYECVVVGDTRADMEAARAAGATAVLVPNSQTDVEDATTADRVEPDLLAAADWIVGVRR